MSVVATTISIILTFGTAYFVDKNKKENEKLEIAKMIKLMKQHRNYCMQLFDITDDDMKEFAQRQVIDDLDNMKTSNDSLSKAWANEFFRHFQIVNKARKQYQE